VTQTDWILIGLLAGTALAALYLKFTGPRDFTEIMRDSKKTDEYMQRRVPRPTRAPKASDKK
jgi:hypothetical protein